MCWVPTFVSTRHPFQILRKGRLSTNQVREYAHLERGEKRSVHHFNHILIESTIPHILQKITDERQARGPHLPLIKRAHLCFKELIMDSGMSKIYWVYTAQNRQGTQVDHHKSVTLEGSPRVQLASKTKKKKERKSVYVHQLISRQGKEIKSARD